MSFLRNIRNISVIVITVSFLITINWSKQLLRQVSGFSSELMII
jgi:hypothetical protein